MRLTLLSLVFVVLATPAFGSTGVVEINQTCAVQTGCFPGDIAGFPVRISAAGSYMLTSNLTVLTDVSAIELDDQFISLDLNGFSIQGTPACNIFGCPVGDASAVARAALFPFSSGGSSSRVHNGVIRSFSGDCLLLGHTSKVDNLRVSSCGRNGVRFGAGGSAHGNSFSAIGQSALHFESTGIFAHNTILSTNTSDGGFPSIVGGATGPGNYCLDGRCEPKATRRYYLALPGGAGVPAGSAETACDAGFHVASIFELYRPEELYYDSSRGIERADSGSGPPARVEGWMRDGQNAWPGGSSTVLANCNALTSSSFFDTGYAYQLLPDVEHPWRSAESVCSTGRPVWCIED